MPIVQNGKAAVALRYIDEQGVEHQVVQVRLGETMVWDGTAPAFVTMPRFTATGQMRVPGVSAGQSFGVPAAAVTSEFRAPLVSAGATVAMPVMSATGQFNAPSVTAAAYVEILAATAQGEVLPVAAGEAAPGAVYMPVITATAGMLPPVIAVPAEVEAQLITAVGEVLTPTVGGHALAQAVAAAASGAVLPPLLSAGQSQATPRATATAGILTPVVSAGATISMPVITATGQVYPTVPPIPMGMDKSTAAQTLPENVWTRVIGWVAASGYPSTVITGDGLGLRAGQYAIDLRLGSTYTSLAFTRGVRIVDGAGNVIASATNAGHPVTLTGTYSIPAGPIYVEGLLNTATLSRRDLQTGTDVHFYATPA